MRKINIHIHISVLLCFSLFAFVDGYSQISIKEIKSVDNEYLYYDVESEEWIYHIGLNDSFEIDTFEIDLIISATKFQYFITLSGNKRLLQESEFQRDYLHGVTNKFDPVSQDLICKTEYSKGVKDGKEIIYYTWTTTYTYKKGKLKCKKVENESGAILEEGKYKERCKSGLWKYYVDGLYPKLKLEESYDNCKLMWKKEYLSNMEEWEK